MKKRLLITGTTGMLGATLTKLFHKKYNVFATGTKNPNFQFVDNFMEFDLSFPDYSKLMDWANPDVIIHCAALTNGNYCEQHPEEALSINGITLHKICNSVSNKTHIIYISTDAVFANDMHNANENDHVKPESIYGKSKEMGEFFLTHSNAIYTIVRTTIVGTNLNKNRESFVEWIINSAKTNKEISLFDDVKFTPITIWNLANQLDYIIRNKDKFSKKIIHIAGGESCTKYEFGMALIKALNLPGASIKNGKISDFADRAKRSTDQTLNTMQYENISQIKLPTLNHTIQEIKDHYNETN